MLNFWIKDNPEKYLESSKDASTEKFQGKELGEKSDLKITDFQSEPVCLLYYFYFITYCHISCTGYKISTLKSLCT